MSDIVCKFGGTSLAGSDEIKKVRDIILTGKKRFVVVSAPGKSLKEDTKITDCLINCFVLAKNGDDFLSWFDIFKKRFIDLKNELKVDIDLKPYFKTLINEIKEHKDYDYVISRGEFFCAKILSIYLGYEFIDAASFITFDKDNSVNLDATKSKFLSLVQKNKKYVIPGFYGKDWKGKIKTFSRGGSDVTGAIVAAVLGAKVYENWTDVDGFFAVDPKFSKNLKLVEFLSYHELRELSYMGANILHPDCVKFLRENNVILNLKNTFNPTCKGSFIMPDRKKLTNKKLTGIAGQKGFTILHIEKFNINESLGIIEEIAKIFKKYNISIEHIPTGIDTVSIIVKSYFINSSNSKSLIDDINKQIKPDRFEILKNISLISVVGNALKNNIEIEKQVFNSLFKSKTKIITLNKGAGGISIILGVPESDFEKTMETLYVSLF